MQEHVSCYGGAGGFPGRLKAEPRNIPFPQGQRERDMEEMLRRIAVIDAGTKRAAEIWALVEGEERT